MPQDLSRYAVWRSTSFGLLGRHIDDEASNRSHSLAFLGHISAFSSDIEYKRWICASTAQSRGLLERHWGCDLKNQRPQEVVLHFSTSWLGVEGAS